MTPSRARSRTPRTVLAAVAAVTVAALAGCGSGSGSGTSGTTRAGDSAVPAAATGSASGAPDLKGVTLRVGQTLWPSLKTEFDLAGLADTPYSVQWSIFPGGDKQLLALGAGAIDVAESSDIPPIFARAANNTRFTVVAVQQSNTLQQEVVARGGSGITSIAELLGKKVAYVKGTTAQYFLAKLLDKAGLKWSDITAVPLSPADGATALAGGTVDALASYGASLQLLEARGAVRIGSGEDILSGNFPIEVGNDVLSDPAKRAAVLDFLHRYNAAAAYARDHARAYVAKEITFTHQPEAAALATFVDGEKQRPTRIVPTSAAAVAAEQDVANTFTALGALPTTVDVASYWSDAFDADLATLTVTP